MFPSPAKLHSLFSPLCSLFLLGSMMPASGDAAAQTPPAWSQGWSVVQLRIPQNGDIQEACAELQTPAGRSVTLTAGERSIEGICLEKLRWSGSPVRAKLTLRNGKELAEVFAGTARISKEQTLQKKEPNVAVDVQLIELPEAVAKTLSIAGEKMLNPAAASGPEKKSAAFFSTGFHAFSTGVLSPEQSQQFLLSLVPQKDVHISKAAGRVARPHLREVIQVKLDAPKHHSGMVLEVEVTATEGGAIDLMLVPQIAELEPSSTQISSKRYIASNVTIFSGQTVILSGFQGPEIAGAPGITTGRMFLLLVTARNQALEQPLQ